MDKTDASALKQVADELRLQAWLAKAELENPSDHEPAVFERLRVLARARDELRVQLALGKLDARDEWEQLEGHWRTVMHHWGDKASSLKQGATDRLDLLHRGYERMRKRL